VTALFLAAQAWSASQVEAARLIAHLGEGGGLRLSGVTIAPIARGYQLSRQGANLLVDGIRISVIWTDWAVPWFLCPACGQRCKHLYLGELLCRTCCHLDYACRHQHRSVPGLYRIKQLRRRLGVDERPFSPLPRRQRRHLRYHRIADEIRLLESRLVSHLAGINRDLQRRIRVRKSKGKW
jgi:hypothetical protein